MTDGEFSRDVLAAFAKSTRYWMGPDADVRHNPNRERWIADIEASQAALNGGVIQFEIRDLLSDYHLEFHGGLAAALLECSAPYLAGALLSIDHQYGPFGLRTQSYPFDFFYRIAAVHQVRVEGHAGAGLEGCYRLTIAVDLLIAAFPPRGAALGSGESGLNQAVRQIRGERIGPPTHRRAPTNRRVTRCLTRGSCR